ncbi:DUF2628 domain-containing protein [Rhodopila sp.]|uniref:DUF2628 domain-containing protein n=1 Tax=Rhodopila sp. TaxID=2480087 RepID=UPI003D112FA1
MRLYGAHLKADAEPVLVREGFSWGAFLFGPIWLAAHRAWIAAAISLAGFVVIAALATQPLGLILGFGLAVGLGLIGHDLRVWSLEHKGYLLVHVVAARGAEEALLRLLTNRPDLAQRYGAGAL